MMPVPMFTVNHDGVKLVMHSSHCHPVVHDFRAECLDFEAIFRQFSAPSAGDFGVACRRAERAE